jgi:hypothetical protein
MTRTALPPIVRSVLVSWDQEAAFRRFTAEFGSWWPYRTHSIGGERVRRVVTFTFHPSREPASAQEVELRFLPEEDGTRLELTATKWENWGKGAARARKGYHVGWGYVLNVWAGRRTNAMRALDVVAGVMRLVERLRGGTDGSIARAGGEIPHA